jgi:hypothetical protein
MATPKARRSGTPWGTATERRDDERDQRDGLQHRDQLLGPPAGADADPLQHGQSAERDEIHRHGVARERRNQLAHVLADDEREHQGAEAPVDPVDPADEETDAVAEGSPGIDIWAAGPRHHGAELGEDVGAEQRDYRADDPGAHEQPRARQRGGDFSRSAENAAADGGADRDGKAEGGAEDAEQAARRSGCADRRRNDGVGHEGGVATLRRGRDRQLQVAEILVAAILDHQLPARIRSCGV